MRTLLRRARGNASALPRLLRVAGTGLFTARDYAAANPGCPGFTPGAQWHWARHGFAELRDPGVTAEQAWLLPLVTSGELSRGAARRVAAGGAPGAAGLDARERDYLEAILAADLSCAAALLEELSGLFRLRAEHKLLRSVPYRPLSAEALRELSGAVAHAAGPRARHDRLRLRDLAVSVGTPWPEVARMNEELARAFAREGAQSGAPGTGVFALPGAIAASAGEDADLLARLYAAAARNAQRTTPGDLEAVAPGGERTNGQDGAVLLLMPDYPTLFSRHATARTVRDTMIALARFVAAAGRPLLPYPQPFARDLARISLPPFPALSYHSYASARPDILHHKELALRGYAFLDREGYSGAATGPSADEAAGGGDPARLDAVVQAYRAGGLSKYDQAAGGAGLPERYLFVPLQIERDSAARWRHLDNEALLSATLDGAAAAGCAVVAKPHPYDGSAQTRRTLDRLCAERGLLVTDADVRTLIEGSLGVVTVNSGVGLEALLLGKPVVAAGSSEYAPAAIPAGTPNALRGAAAALARGRVPAPLRPPQDYLAAFFARHAFEADLARREPDRLGSTILPDFLG